ncbi:MAG: tetratricopeptide repeat protein [Desulfobacterales bacterium]|nr:tetratricopeptide repeat protein [Desulfobacterales bacterium]
MRDAGENDAGENDAGENDAGAEVREEAPGFRIHMGIAEQGKLYALAGDYKRALHYYRHAMKMAVDAGDPEVFFRHYLECVIEALEHMGSYGEILDYCDKAVRFYEDHPPPNPVAWLDLANIHQRKGVILLKTGDNEAAGRVFRKALEIARDAGGALNLSKNLLRWIDGHMHIEPSRVLSEQKRMNYFSVRRDVVDPTRAIKLPNENTPGF